MPPRVFCTRYLAKRVQVATCVCLPEHVPESLGKLLHIRAYTLHVHNVELALVQRHNVYEAL